MSLARLIRRLVGLSDPTIPPFLQPGAAETIARDPAVGVQRAGLDPAAFDLTRRPDPRTVQAFDRPPPVQPDLPLLDAPPIESRVVYGPPAGFREQAHHQQPPPPVPVYGAPPAPRRRRWPW